ncbi:Glutathione S-transferase domain protein [Sphingobium chlorophenolicum L-1]|uniref:Glutathione S-transferase domain protein n=1 Tax=Sphingobium chlorophenolicum L-1 TaxID=690566 RepID=F6F1N0_SPHCR|nr:glutathione binding-like protein [Sphingobium chlorophenolicum]AEG51446.1 Glutathione S-transferase domain protein [Sphingobium chlorophenolicum L-1]
MIELFTSGAPSPRKVSIMLEEVGLPYKWHWINVYAAEHKKADFLALNPNGRLPAILDHDTGGEPLLLWESAAILIYLAEKSGKLLPASGPARYQVLKWASFQATHAPYLGNAHWYRVLAPAPERYSIDRFVQESARIYQVVDDQLGKERYVAGEDYSIADVSIFPWIEYHDWQGQDLADFPHIRRWYDEVAARPAVERGRNIPYPYTEFGDSPESRQRGAQIMERLSDPERRASQG